MTNKNKAPYGLNISGVVRVFRKDRQVNSKGRTFNISDVWFTVGEQDEQGNWTNKSMNLLFKKGIEPPLHNSTIEIIEAFPVLRGKGQYQQIALMVMGWYYAPGYPVPQQNYNQAPQGGYNNRQQNYNQGYVNQ